VEKPIRLRRSTLSVPPIAKDGPEGLHAPTDVLMLDLEDSVPVPEKEEARKRVIAAFKEQDWSGKVRCYRINGMDTPFAYRDIIDIVEAAGDAIDVIVVAKVNDAAEIKAIDYLLTQIEMRMGFQTPIGLEASIETPKGCSRSVR